MSAIQTLIDEGVLVLWHDYRSGHADDLSGQGNDGTPSGVVWNREGARFSAGSQKITAASAIGGAAARSAVILHRSQSAGANNAGRLLDDGKLIFYMNTASGSIALTSDGFGVIQTTVGGVAKFGALGCVGFSRDAAGACSIYSDGVFVVSGATGTPIAGTTDSVIGSNAAGTRALEGNVLAVVVASRVLTATEHAAVYAELESMRWPQKKDRAATAYDGAATQLQWGTDWGTPVTENRTAGQRVGPFEIISGTHKVVTDTTEGKICKVIECVVAGKVEIPSGQMRQTPGEAAYGTSVLWLSKAAGSNLVIELISNTSGGIDDGYRMVLNSNERIDFYRMTGGAVSSTRFLSANGVVPSGWGRYRISRSATGIVSIYLDGSLIPATVAGANPTLADNTYTESKFLTFDLDAGDKIALADVGGGHSVLKYQGVVAP